MENGSGFGHDGVASGFRKKFLIYPSLQLKVISYGLSIAAVGALSAVAATKYVFWRSAQVLKETGVALDHPVFRFLTEQERTFDFFFLLSGFTGFVIAFGLGVQLSHRVAGPVVRLRRHLDRSAAGGAPEKVIFREEDFFHDLAEAYNRDLEARGKIRRPGSELNRLVDRHRA